MSDWITITSKFANKCLVCGNMVDIGERVNWKKGEGIKHVKDCQPCEAVTPTTDLIIVEDSDDWKDPAKHPYDKVLEIMECQKCGKVLDKTKDTFINNDRRVCMEHAFV